jgi:single-stranded-DNA-specific exonuclease
MTLKPERLFDFKARFESVVAGSIREDQKSPTLEVDSRLAFADINDRFYRILRQFAPYGPGNLAPLFQSNQLLDRGSKLVGSDKSHLKVSLLEPASGKIMRGIGFGLAEKIKLLQSGKPVSVLYHLEENEFNGYRNLELVVKDIKPDGES